MGKYWVYICLIVVAFVNSFTAKGVAEVGIYELKKGDLCVQITNWGATLVSLSYPDKHGNMADVVLGYDTVEEYKNGTANFGATVGRVANRIAGAQFRLNGTVYKLIANDGKNTLHGGPRGFGKVVWTVVKHQAGGHAPFLSLRYHSPDGDQGFPGDVRAYVNYILKGDNQLHITMKAFALNKPTPINLANHAYWNLGGQNSGDILNHTIQIFASQITPVDKNLIPTGEFSPVKNTPYDFRYNSYKIGSKINKLQYGYDINYVIDEVDGEKMKVVAKVRDEKTGRSLEIKTDAKGVQFYTSNWLVDVKGKGGYVYEPHAGLCLETQGFPDAVNHPNFPSQIVYPGKAYKHSMLLRFSAY